MDTLQLVLVRHGFSLGNEKHLLSGWSDVPLTDKGRQELRLLRQQMDYPQTQKYYSSDLCRCTETFQIIYEGRAELDGLLPQFREIYFGSLENCPESELPSREFFAAWLRGERIGNGETFDGETFEGFRSRITGALDDLIRRCREEKTDSVTVVTHSGVIRTLLLSLRHLEGKGFPAISTPNGLGYVLKLGISQPQPELIECEPISARPALSRQTG